MSWLQPTRFEIAVVADVRRRWPEIVPLARLLAAATRVEPLLLRNARRHFLPGSSTEIELLFWFSPLVGARSSSEVILHPGAARVLIHRLRRREPERFAAATAFIRAHTRHWSAEDRLEQELRLDAMHQDRDAVQRGLRDMLKRLHDNEPEEGGQPDQDSEQRRIRLARWSRRTLATIVGAENPPDEALLLAQYASHSLGTIAVLPAGSGALPPPPGWLADALPAPYRPAKLAVELHYDADLQRQVLHFVAPSEGAPAIDLPTPLPANLHVEGETGSSGWHVVSVDTRVELAATKRVVLSTIAGRRYELLVELPPSNDDDGSGRAAPLLYLSHLAEDHQEAREIAEWLRRQGLRVILRHEGRREVESAPAATTDGEPARLLRLWTHAAQRLAASEGSDALAAGTREALLRIDPTVQPPAAGYGAEKLLDLPDWRKAGAATRANGFVQQLHEWLGKAAPVGQEESMSPSAESEVDRLLKELANPKTTPPRRLEIGDRLNEIGDPRPGVGVREYVLQEYPPEVEALLTELDQPATIPPRRLAIGDRLAEIGDPRRGVSLDSRGLPEIDWVDIPGGEFIYQEGERRSLASFRMARYPVTKAQYQAFIYAGGYRDDRWWKELGRLNPESCQWPQANRPRTNVGWYEAVAFSRWLSAQLGYEVRLPNEQEWERAARGVEGREYPWGNEYASGRANIDEISTIQRVGEWYLEQTTAVGVYPHGASSEGVLDLSGSVWEWCLNKYDRPDETRIDTSGDTRVLRGGSWRNHADLARGSLRMWYNPDYRSYTRGFRLVSSAPVP